MAVLDPAKNFAHSTVATAPSPATSGTSLVLASGDGTKFPDPATEGAYNVIIYPTMTQPTAANAEIVRVTAKSTDTLTITRTQESTSARTIIVGDVVALNLTKLFRDNVNAALFSWEGAWATSTAYVVNDIVENDGSSYVCVSAHTSGASTEPGVGASWGTYWDLLTQGTDPAIDDAWASWTPTFSLLTIGNGSYVAKYKQVGKTVHLILKIIWGSTTSASGNWGTFTLPVNASSDYTVLRNNVGGVYILDSGTAEFTGFARVESSTQGRAVVTATASTYAGVTSLSATVPMTWTTNDVINIEMIYEAA